MTDLELHASGTQPSAEPVQLRGNCQSPPFCSPLRKTPCSVRLLISLLEVMRPDTTATSGRKCSGLTPSPRSRRRGSTTEQSVATAAASAIRCWAWAAAGIRRCLPGFRGREPQRRPECHTVWNRWNRGGEGAPVSISVGSKPRGWGLARESSALRFGSGIILVVRSVRLILFKRTVSL